MSTTTTTKKTTTKKTTHKAPARELSVIAAEINTKLRGEVSGVLEIGALLLEAKRAAGHGNWQTWLQGNFNLSERTAQKYIAAHRWASKYELSAVLNLTPTILYDFSSKHFFDAYVPNPAVNKERVIEVIMDALKTIRLNDDNYEDYVLRLCEELFPLPPDTEPTQAEVNDELGLVVDDAEVEAMLDNPTDIPPGPSEPQPVTLQAKADAASAGPRKPTPVDVKAKADRAEAPPTQPDLSDDIKDKADAAEQSAEQRKALYEAMEGNTPEAKAKKESAHALAEFEYAVKTYMARMDSDDLCTAEKMAMGMRANLERARRETNKTAHAADAGVSL